MKDSDLDSWVGRTEQSVDTFGLDQSQKLAATMGLDAGQAGDPLPPLAHWCAFSPMAGMADLGADGHPKLGGFLPPINLSRRMWAGGAFEFFAPLHVGSQITRQSTITSIQRKTGAAGPMVFVTLTHDVHDGATLALRETQDIVYLEIPDTFSPPPKKPVPATPDLFEPVEISEALLFRFSAVTFNAHRIHYDLAYARDVEKYPGLVVHGPLQAMVLIQAAIRFSGRAPKRFTFRGVHPMFHFDDLHVFGTRTETGMALCTGLVGGHQGMTGDIVWEDRS